MSFRQLACRPLAMAGPAAVAGVALGPAGLPWALAFAAGLVAWSAARRSAPPLVLLAGFLAGLAAAHRLRMDTPRPWPRAPPRVGTCRLRVVDCGEDPVGNRAWFTGRIEGGTGVLCSWNGRAPDGLAPGSVVRIRARFRTPRPAGNPGQRDTRARLAESGISLLADLRAMSNLEIEQSATGPGATLARLRRAGVRRLARLLPADTAPLAAALLLGVRAGLEDAHRRRFERTGTMHLLAISGVHVLLLAGMVHALLRRMGAGVRTAAGVTLALAVLYVPLTGGAAPIRRAVTVLSFFALALVRGRAPDPASALGGAALVLALWNPSDVLSIGFALSFAAAGGILWLAGPWRRRWSRRHHLLARFPAVRADRPVRLRIHGYLLKALPVALSAWIATQGIVAWAFGIVTPFAPLTNVLVAPIVGLLLPQLALLALGLDWLSLPVTWTMRGLCALLDASATVPGGCVFVPATPWLAVALWCAGGLLLRRTTRFGILLLAAGIALAWPEVRPGEPAIRLLDVGHGQAALIRLDDGEHVLVDAGSRGRPRLARRVLVPMLRACGVHRLKAVVCTHADADHWNAMPELLRLLPVERVFVGRTVPHALADSGVPIVRARAGDTIHAGSWSRLSVLLAGGPGSSNDRSLVLVFEAAGRRALLPADREERGLETILALGLGRFDVLVAPHHGARCDAAAFVGRAIRPDWLLVSNAEGFAHAPTLARYGGHVLETARGGCLTVRFRRSGDLELTTFR